MIVPSLESIALTDRAVLWAAAPSDRYGETRVHVATEIASRWASGDAWGAARDGDGVALTATVHVEEAVPLGSLLWKGTLADWAADPAAGGARLVQVKAVNEVSDLKGREAGRTLTVTKFAATLPEVVP